MKQSTLHNSPEEWRRLFAWLLFRLNGDAATAEDLLQETKLAALQGGGAETGWAWLLSVARNKLRNHYRGRDRERRALMAVAAGRPQDLADPVEPEALRAESSGLLFRLTLSSLAPEDQNFLLWKYRDGADLESIAQRTGKSVEAVKSALARARERFRQTWKLTAQSREITDA